MSRKAFILWGLVIISFIPFATAAALYLGLSNIIEQAGSATFLTRAAVFLALAHLILIPIIFGVVLHLRLKEIGRRKRILALCLAFYILSFPLMTFLSVLYNNYIIMESGASTRFYEAIGEWERQDDPKSATPWTIKHKIDFVLVMLPMTYIGNLNLFALLWFGNLDPRKPSKNRIVQFFKTGFQRKPNSAQIEVPNLVPT